MIRLAKYIADSGYCSRRAASRLIDAGTVQVNGRAGNHIDRISETDQVKVDGQLLTGSAEPRYFIYNKPIGIESVCEPDNPDSIVHHLPESGRVYPVGRLDKDSHGLLLLTNNGELCQRILHPDYYHEKEYLVEVNKPLESDFCDQMSAGVRYKEITTRPCTVTKTSECCFRIILTQGLNRQIRNMAKALGYYVTDLQRIRLINLHLDQLPENAYRELTTAEVNTLHKSLGL